MAPNVRYEIRIVKGQRQLMAIVTGDKGEKEYLHNPLLNNDDYLAFYKGKTADMYSKRLKAITGARPKVTTGKSISSLLKPGVSSLTFSLEATQGEIDDVYRGLIGSLAKDEENIGKLMNQKEQLAHRLVLKADYDGYANGNTKPAGDIQVVSNATIEQFVQALKEALPIGTYLDSTRWAEAVNVLTQSFPNLTSEGNPQKQDIVGCTITATLMRGG